MATRKVCQKTAAQQNIYFPLSPSLCLFFSDVFRKHFLTVGYLINSRQRYRSHDLAYKHTPLKYLLFVLFRLKDGT